MMHWLPYNKITKWIVIAGAEEQIKWLNSFPAKGRVSNVLSPRIILTGKPIDFTK